jgi:hypothetical protein
MTKRKLMKNLWLLTTLMFTLEQVDDTEMVKGLVFDHKASHLAGGPTRIENAKIGLIQFQISPPKTDIEQSVIVSDYTQVSHHLIASLYMLSLSKWILKNLVCHTEFLSDINLAPGRWTGF